MAKSKQKPSKKLTDIDAQIIIARLATREYQNRIAADFDVNQGRISEIKTGKTFPDLSRPWG